MTPDPSFVRDLKAYDPLLRVRYGIHTEKWILERKMPTRSPQYLAERPASERSARAKDLALGWAQGYVHVLSVDPSLLAWHHVAPALRDADLHFAGSWKALNQRLDDAEAAWYAAKDREQTDWAQQASYEAFDHLGYLEKRRVSMAQPEERVEQHEGYVVRDRRVQA
jgi:hypothetical protein